MLDLTTFITKQAAYAATRPAASTIDSLPLLTFIKNNGITKAEAKLYGADKKGKFVLTTATGAIAEIWFKPEWANMVRAGQYGRLSVGTFYAEGTGEPMLRIFGNNEETIAVTLN